MTATIHRIASARAAKRRRKTDRQAYAAAMAEQRRATLDDETRELEDLIGPPGGDWPGGHAA